MIKVVANEHRGVSPQSHQELADEANISKRRITKASIVLRYAPELVDDVIHGGSLDAAYKVATDAIA